MKNKIIKAVLLVLLCIFLTSCEAVDELTGKGVWAWLGIDNPFMSPSETTTPSPDQTAKTDVTPSPTPDVSATKTPVQGLPNTPRPIPTYPTVDQLISGLERVNMNRAPLMISCSEQSGILTWQNAEGMYEILSKVNNYFNGNVFIDPVKNSEELEKGLSFALEGNYYTDLLFLSLKDAIEYASRGLLAPVDTTRLADSKGCFDLDINSAAEINGVSYAISSSYFPSYESNIVLYINTDLLKRLDVEIDLYRDIENGKWTWETVYMICKAAEIAKEKTELDFSVAGSVFSPEVTRALLYSSSGSQLTRSDDEGKEIIDFDVYLYPKMLTSISTFMSSEGYLSEDAAKDAFYRGELLMMVGKTSMVRDYYQSYDSYAAVCLPKADESQERYYTVVDPETVYVFAFPKNSNDPELAYSVVNYLSYLSQYCYKYEFIENLYSYYVRQSNSIPYFAVNDRERIVPRAVLFGNHELLSQVADYF